MAFVYTFAGIVFIMGFFEFYDCVDGFFSFLGQAVLHAVVIVFAAIMGAAVALVIGFYMPKHWEAETSTLASLKDANGIEGNFVLGTGSIETAQYYMWYEKDGNGYRPNKVKVGYNVLIVEDSTLVNTGTVEVSKRKMNNKKLGTWLVFDASTWSDQYKFTIPKGSIKKDFKLE